MTEEEPVANLIKRKTSGNAWVANLPCLLRASFRSNSRAPKFEGLHIARSPVDCHNDRGKQQ